MKPNESIIFEAQACEGGAEILWMTEGWPRGWIVIPERIVVVDKESGKKAELPVVKIGEHVFEECYEVKRITVPESVEEIGEWAFCHCRALKELVIPKQVKKIAASAFTDCASLKRIVVDEENERYRAIDGVLFSKDGETLVAYPKGKGAKYRVPEGTKRIGADAFCFTGLRSILLPDGLEEIGVGAFFACPLKKVLLPASVTRLGNIPFMFETVVIRAK